MTKKFITGEGKKGKIEFVIPDIVNKKNKFIGIESGNNYETGRICYTGVELSADKVMEKILKKWDLNFLQKRQVRKIINSYLIQIKEFKISKEVKIGPDFKLELVDTK